MTRRQKLPVLDESHHSSCSCPCGIPSVLFSRVYYFVRNGSSVESVAIIIKKEKENIGIKF